MFVKLNIKTLLILLPPSLATFLLGFIFPSNAQIPGVYPNLKLPYTAGQSFKVEGTHDQPTRRALDWGMYKQPVLAMKSGRVDRVTTDQYGGKYILVDHNDGFCSIYLHLDSFNVKEGTSVQQGSLLGISGNTGLGGLFHLHTAVIQKVTQDSRCSASHTREISMGFIENKNIPLKLYDKVVSQNGSVNTTPPPVSNAFVNPTSSLSVNQASVNLFVKADNLANRTIYWQMYRGQVGTLAPITWGNQQFATSNSITLGNLDGPGDTLKGVYYFTVVSLSPIAPGEAAKQRTKCSDATGRVQLCDFRNR